eukprot:CAMPEP_0117841650 /NCGR_PEP_ID=MMETSP0949-20121206/15458_1 /TAXON_ID=44440 /ORGANISM="Chattonella subsalsa, Strain CCMP2191" /LENGTH=70 /DNA_ID=CAMNT_0005685373 /DNA_START=341 /DNA_END=550 /DNA_ORIENTATION=+
MVKIKLNSKRKSKYRAELPKLKKSQDDCDLNETLNNGSGMLKKINNKGFSEEQSDCLKYYRTSLNVTDTA